MNYNSISSKACYVQFHNFKSKGLAREPTIWNSPFWGRRWQMKNEGGINEEIKNLKSKSTEISDLKSNHIIFDKDLEFKNIYFRYPNGKEIMKNLL